MRAYTAETRAKISKALKGKPKSEAHRAKLSKALIGRNIAEELGFDIPKKEEIEELYYRQKLSVRKVAEVLNVDRGKLKYWMKKYGIRIRTADEAAKLRIKTIPKEQLDDLYVTQKLTIDQIAEKLDVSRQVVIRSLRHYDIPTYRYHREHKRTKNRWGYVTIYKPEHPRAKKGNGRVFEHIVVWEQAHGHSLPIDWVIHHINGKRDDNHPGNLFALPRKSHHAHLILQQAQKRIRSLEEEIKKYKSQGKLPL